MDWLTDYQSELTTEYEHVYRDRRYPPRHRRRGARPNPGRVQPVSQSALPFG